MPAPPARYKAELFFEGYPLVAMQGRVWGRFQRVRTSTPGTPGPRRVSARPPKACVVILVEILKRRGGAPRRHRGRGWDFRRYLPIYQPLIVMRPRFRHPANSHGTGRKTLQVLGSIFRVHRLVQLFLPKIHPKRAKHVISGWFGR